MQRSPSKFNLQAFPRPYFMLCIGTLVNRLGGFVVPFLTLYLTRARGFTIVQAGGIACLYGLGSLIASALGGVVADRLGRRRTMLIALWGGGAAMALLAFGERPVIVASEVFLLALVADLYRPAASAMVADLVEPDHRVAAYGYLYWATNAGFAVASVLGGLLARRGYDWLFAIDIATSWLFGAIVWRAVPETLDPRVRRPSSPGMSDVLRDGRFVSFVALSFLIAAVLLQQATTLPMDMSAHGLTETSYGVTIALNGILVIVLQPFAGAFLGKWSRFTVLGLAAILVGAGFGLYAFAASATWYRAGVVLWSLGEIAMAPAASALVAELSPVHLRGRYQGVFAMSWALATIVGPAAGVLLLDRWGAATLWSSCFGVCAAVAVTYLLTFRQRTAAASPATAISRASAD